MNEEIHGATEHSARMTLIREAVIYTPLFVAGIVLTLLSVVRVLDAGPVLTGIEAILTVLFGYQSIQALRDLRSPLMKTEGVVGRRWSKMDFIVTRSHYIAVGRKIFSLPVEDWYLIQENERVAVLHYPHTGTVAKLDRVEDSPGGR
jgi:hypothetical protein